MMTAKDPVWGMDVEIATAQWKTEYSGQTYYYCAPGYQRSFEQGPDIYHQDDPQEDMSHSGHPSH